MENVKHLLIDLDGTLLGNRNIALGLDFLGHAFSALKPYGNWKRSVRALWDIGNELRRKESDFTNDNRVVEAFARRMNLPMDQARTVLREGVTTIFPKLRKHFYPIEGAKDFLDWAKEHYPMTLATNPVWPTDIIELRVKWAGIDPSIFGSITHVRKMRSCKPTKAYYREILAQQGLRPEDCLLIGDNVKMDLPATTVGIPVYIVGPYKEVRSVKYPGAKAKAWKGSYPDLRKLLERRL